MSGGCLIGISDRPMRRWKQPNEEYGHVKLFDCRRRKPSPKRGAEAGGGRGGAILVVLFINITIFDFALKGFDATLFA